ncbi:AN1-type zinc finger protein 2A isoform X2 [Anabrus simplex]|uniref:AN1-type zinc finger protein 2A isoform X2 n=1 Tax=Anabrus simplex TaxID=316456 RepID=UPI0035A291DC
MEFPHLGQHCTEPTCKQLDYLPLKCDACQSIFCREHISYINHNCPSSYKKDVQVPVCPLCNIPIPGKRGEQPDIAVGAHIDDDCQSDPAKNRRKIFTNKCSVKGCKGKEIVPITCGDCKLNFCLKHRHPADHQCEGPAAAARRRAAEAAMARHARLKSTGAPSSSNPAPNTNRGSVMVQSRIRSKDTVTGIQGSLSLQESGVIKSCFYKLRYFVCGCEDHPDSS